MTAPADALHVIEQHLIQSPPQGISRRYIRGFFVRLRPRLMEVLEAQLKARRSPVGGDRVVTLNLGLGRDSFAMLCLLLEGRLVAQGTRVRRSDVSAVVFSDTGAEWKHSYELLPLAAELCRQAGLRWLHLRKPPADGEVGWKAWLDLPQPERKGAQPWRALQPATIEARAENGHYHLRPPIREDYQSRCTVISLKRQDCTANHKILPIRRLIEDIAREAYGVDSNRAWGKEVRAKRRRPHLSLIGYAADEKHRYEDLDESAGPDYAEEAYPLVELGITKADEQAILERWNLAHVNKSGCRICPYQPVAWYWALRETDPEGWSEVLAYERASLSRNARMTVLAGGRQLEDAVDRWRAANPEITVEQVLTKAYARCSRVHKTEAESLEVLPEACALPGDALLIPIRARVLIRTRAHLS